MASAKGGRISSLRCCKMCSSSLGLQINLNAVVLIWSYVYAWRTVWYSFYFFLCGQFSIRDADKNTKGILLGIIPPLTNRCTYFCEFWVFKTFLGLIFVCSHLSHFTSKLKWHALCTCHCVWSSALLFPWFFVPCLYWIMLCFLFTSPWSVAYFSLHRLPSHSGSILGLCIFLVPLSIPEISDSFPP